MSAVLLICGVFLCGLIVGSGLAGLSWWWLMRHQEVRFGFLQGFAADYPDEISPHCPACARRERQRLPVPEADGSWCAYCGAVLSTESVSHAERESEAAPKTPRAT